MANLDSVVDLGLPSGTKWAKMNIGAKLPADYGDYFAWGSITPNADKDIQDSLEDMWGDEAYDVIIKSIDIITANPDFDAATAIWGSAWRIPTRTDFKELREECEWVWTSYTTVDGENVPGYKVIGSNGNTIFLPAAGYRSEGTREDVNIKGYYIDNKTGFVFEQSHRGNGELEYNDQASIRPVVSSTEWKSIDWKNRKKLVNHVVDSIAAYQAYVNSQAYKDSVAAYEAYVNSQAYKDSVAAYEAYVNSQAYKDSVAAYRQAYADSVFNVLALQTSIKAVDLGLSVKWANMNVGANSPVDYGDYFAWGETKPKAEYTEENSLTYEKEEFNFDIAGNVKYDAARANWGGKWKMPTSAQMQELVDNCTWTWIPSSKLDAAGNTIKGYVVSNCAAGNTNSIFLPAAGYRSGSDLEGAGSDGFYWSSTPRGGNSEGAYGLYFGSGCQLVGLFAPS